MHSSLLMHLGILNEAMTLINVFSLTGGKNALIMGLDKNFWKLYESLCIILYIWPNLNYGIHVIKTIFSVTATNLLHQSQLLQTEKTMKDGPQQNRHLCGSSYSEDLLSYADECGLLLLNMALQRKEGQIFQLQKENFNGKCCLVLY